MLKPQSLPEGLSILLIEKVGAVNAHKQYQPQAILEKGGEGFTKLTLCYLPIPRPIVSPRRREVIQAAHVANVPGREQQSMRCRTILDGAQFGTGYQLALREAASMPAGKPLWVVELDAAILVGVEVRAPGGVVIYRCF